MNKNKKACIQILRGEGDWGNNIVNFYYSDKPDSWVWCYIDHEIGERKWEVSFDKSGNYVLVRENGDYIAGYDTKNDIFMLRDVYRDRAYPVALSPEHQTSTINIGDPRQRSNAKHRVRNIEELQKIIKHGDGGRK